MANLDFELNVKYQNALKLFKRVGGHRKARGGYTAEAKRSLQGLLEVRRQCRKEGVKVSSLFDTTTPTRKALISLTTESLNKGFARLKEKNPRKQNTEVESGYSNAFYDRYFEYKGRHKGWSGSFLVCQVKSVGFVSDDGKMLGWVVDDKKGFLSAPHGYHWDLINEHIALVRNATGDEYHIEGEDLALTPRAIAAKLRELAERRKQARGRLGEVAKGVHQSIVGLLKKHLDKTISVSHSWAVGNCKAGTRMFLSQLGFSKVEELYVVKGCDLEAAYLKNWKKTNASDQKRFLLALQHFDRLN